MTAFTRSRSDSDRGKEVRHRRVVGAVGVDVTVTHLISRPDDERGAELCDALARLVDAMSPLPCRNRRRPSAGVQEPIPRSDPNRSGVRRLAVVVDEHEVRDVFVSNERAGIPLIAGPDRDEFDPLTLEFLIPVPELGRVLAAVQASEMPEKHDDDGLVAPKVAEPVRVAVGIGK